MEHLAHKLGQEHTLPFIIGGDATFTIRNAANGNRYTYRVGIPKDSKPENAEIFFVSLLTGSNNETDYQYIGVIRWNGQRFNFTHGVKSKIGPGAPGVVAFEFTFNRLVAMNRTHKDLEVWHEGRCCRCGRTLTVPESIESGIGPDCASISAKRRQRLSELFTEQLQPA